MLVGALPDHTCMPILHTSWPIHHALISFRTPGLLRAPERWKAAVLDLETWSRGEKYTGGLYGTQPPGGS